jgi:hypothetical protein
MRKITAFQTTDGKLFDNNVEASKHEESLKAADQIDAFLDHADNPYVSGPQRSIARNTIINWIIWKNKNAE